MSGPSIQPIGSVLTQAAAPATTPAAGAAGAPAMAAQATPPAAQPASVAAVELDFSALARALDKLAQTPGVDAKILAQLTRLIQEQGALPALLEQLGQPDGPGKNVLQALPAELRPLAEALLGAGAPQGENRQPGAASPAPAAGTPASGTSQAVAQESQHTLTQAVQNFTAALKGTLAPLFEGVTASAAPPLEAGTGATGAAAGAAAAPGLGGKAGLPQSIQQFVQTQLDQVSGLLKQFTGRPPGSVAALAPSGSAAGAPAPAAAALLTPEQALQPAAAVAEELRRMQSAGKLLDSPLIRKEFIRATLGVVATLLSDPVFSDAAPPRPATATQTPASPTPAAAPAPGGAAEGAAAPNPAVLAQLQSVLREIGGLRGLLTQGGRETWGRTEPELIELAQQLDQQAGTGPGTVRGANPQTPANPLPGRLAEAARRGVSFELQLRESPRLEAAVAELRHNGVQADVNRGERSRFVQLRVTVAGGGPKAETPRPAGAPAPAAPHPRPGKPETPAAPPAASGKAPHAAKDPFTALSFATAGEAEALADPGDGRPASHARNESYAHPEAFRSPFQAQQDAAMIQMVAFFHTRREDVIQGRRFDPAAEPQAEGRVMPANRLLEYKPIEVIWPTAGGDAGQEGNGNGANAAGPVIDVKPVSVRRR